MKRAAIVVALLLCASGSANAATAYLQGCQAGISVTGQSIYIGTYMYGGSTFQRAFPMAGGYCPQTVEVY